MLPLRMFKAHALDRAFQQSMLDGFEILTSSGVVLWSKSYASVNSSIINGFIKDVFIEEKVLPGASVADDASATQNPSYKRDQYTLKWASVKDLGLIFVVRLNWPRHMKISTLIRRPGSLSISDTSYMD